MKKFTFVYRIDADTVVMVKAGCTDLADKIIHDNYGKWHVEIIAVFDSYKTDLLTGSTLIKHSLGYRKP